ncbi:hypothetical protein E2491_10135 [Jeotgalibacillus sp. R-1-5s-1]|nr:hypothetical protein E2491_10135 [Jeotgalibacillus sp. R-1-5s-1]
MVMVLLISPVNPSEAASDDRLFVKWDNGTLIEGQIGRVNMVKNAVLFKLENGKLIKTNLLRKAGNTYRIYSFIGSGNSLYIGVGGGYYFHNTTATVYQTPSPTKKKQLAALIEQFEKEKAQNAATVSQAQAIRMAKEYLDYMPFSKIGLIEQLEYEGFSNADATYAVENISVNWRAQAVKTAEDYLDFTSFSRTGLIEQLEFEGFSNADATYAANAVGL